jgi:hypothetical protein
MATWLSILLTTPFPLEEHGSFLALGRAFTRAFRLYSYGGKGVEGILEKMF